MKQALIILITMAAGAFLWWTVSPLFIDKTADDALPESSLPTNPNPAANEDLTEPDLESEADAQASKEPADLPPPKPTLFPIKDTPAHPASGNVRIVETPEEKIIRYEDYDGTNGPDLKIYLAKDLEATDFLNLGPARANQGNINYSVPMNVDISEYKYVLTWCEAFGVLFDYAEIN